MHIESLQQRVSKWITFICGALTILVALWSLNEWYGYQPFFKVEWLDHMRYNTAVVLLLIGVALIYLTNSLQFYLEIIIGVFAAVIGLLTLAETSSMIDLQLDTVFFKSASFDPGTLFEGRLGPFFCVLVGIALIINPKRSDRVWRTILQIALGLAIAFLASGGLLLYIIAIETELSFLEVDLISLSAATGFIIAGIGLVASSYYHAMKHGRDVKNWGSIFIVFSGFILVILITHGLLAQQESLVEAITYTKSQEIRGNMLEAFANLSKPLERLNQNMSKHIEKLAPSEWIEEASTYLIDYPELDALVWVDSSFVVQAFVNQKKTEKPPIQIDSKLKERLLSSNEALIIQHNTILQPYNFTMYTPIRRENKFLGVLIGYVNGKKLFKNAFQTILIEHYYINVSINGIQLYQFNQEKKKQGARWMYQEIVKVQDLNLVLQVAPTIEAFRTQMNRFFIYTIFLLGFAVSTLLGVFVYLWERDRGNLIKLKAVQSDLHTNQERLQFTLQSIGMGTWIWDIERDLLTIDDYGYFLLGLPPGPSPKNLAEYLALCYPPDLERIKQDIIESIKSKEVYLVEDRVVHPDGSVHDLAIQGKIHRDEEGVATKFVGIAWDITVPKQQKNLIEMQFRIANIVREARSLRDSMPEMLKVIGEALTWDIVILSILDPTTKEMAYFQAWYNPALDLESFIGKIKRFEIWYNPALDLEAFIGKIKRFEILQESSLPVRVWKEQKVIGIADISQEHGADRYQEAIEQGIKGALAFPIYVNQKFLGVLELLRVAAFRENIDNPLVVTMVNTIASEIGLCIQQSYTEELRQRLLAIMTNSNDAIIGLSLDYEITSWNKGAETIFGYLEEEALGKEISDFILAKRAQEGSWIRTQVQEGKTIEHLEIMLRRKNRNQFWALVTVSPLKDHDGHITGACAFIQDITNIKRNEEVLRKSEERFRVFVETTGEWIWEMDIWDKITYSNPAVTMFLGYSEHEVLGMDVLFLVAEEDRATFAEEMAKHIVMKKGWVGRTMRWKHKDGSYRWLESNAEAIFDDKDALIGFRGADRDVTKRKSFEVAQNEFVSTVSHELRTPLTAIKGGLELVLAKNKLSDRSKQLLEIASSNTDRLIRIINDILDVEKLATKKMPLAIESVSIKMLIDDAIKMNKSYADKFDVTLLQEGGPFEDMNIKGNYDRLMQVMYNLISNAVKFSPTGGQVFISVSEGDNKVKVAVRDEGKGIPEEFHARIFQRFAQADSSSSRIFSGTGLGLSICKQIIEQLGGTIWFDSKKNHGTIFYFELPKAT